MPINEMAIEPNTENTHGVYSNLNSNIFALLKVNFSMISTKMCCNDSAKTGDIFTFNVDKINWSFNTCTGKFISIHNYLQVAGGSISEICWFDKNKSDDFFNAYQRWCCVVRVNCINLVVDLTGIVGMRCVPLYSEFHGRIYLMIKSYLWGVMALRYQVL